jgi:hypothetical protein
MELPSRIPWDVHDVRGASLGRVSPPFKGRVLFAKDVSSYPGRVSGRFLACHVKVWYK